MIVDCKKDGIMKKRYFLKLYSLLNICCIYSMNQQCYLDQLPREIHGKIIENVFNLKCDLKNDIRKKLLTVDLLLGCKFVDEVCKIEELCVKRIFIDNGLDVASLTRAIFSLSKEERGALSAAASPRFLDYNTIDKDTYSIILSIKNKNITKGLCMDVASKDKRVRRYLKIRAIAQGCFFMGSGMLNVVKVIDGLLLDYHYELNKCPLISYIVPAGVIAVGIGAMLWVVACSMLPSRKGDSYKEKVYIKTKRL